jgi:hypothetical protein
LCLPVSPPGLIFCYTFLFFVTEPLIAIIKSTSYIKPKEFLSPLCLPVSPPGQGACDDGTDCTVCPGKREWVWRPIGAGKRARAKKISTIRTFCDNSRDLPSPMAEKKISERLRL